MFQCLHPHVIQSTERILSSIVSSRVVSLYPSCQKLEQGLSWPWSCHAWCSSGQWARFKLNKRRTLKDSFLHLGAPVSLWSPSSCTPTCTSVRHVIKFSILFKTVSSFLKHVAEGNAHLDSELLHLLFLLLRLVVHLPLSQQPADTYHCQKEGSFDLCN